MPKESFEQQQKIIFPALSAIIHVVIIAALLMPASKNQKNTVQQKQIIAIEIARLDKTTNIKVATDTEKTTSNAAEVQPEKMELVKKPDLADQEVQIQATQNTEQHNTATTIAAAEAVTAQDNAPVEKPKPTPPKTSKPDTKKIAPPQKKPVSPKQSNQKDDELFNLLKNIAPSTKVATNAQQDTKKTSGMKGLSDQKFNDEKQTTMKITDMVQSRFMSCWHIPAAAKDIQSIKVTLKLTMDQTGSVTRIRILDYARYQNDEFFHAVTNSALRAIQFCSPISELQNYDYHIWAEITLTFDPGALLEQIAQ